MKQPSKSRGCDDKANLGRSFVKQANRLSIKHRKQYGVYRCPHCQGTHLTTKLDKKDRYAELLWVTVPLWLRPKSSTPSGVGR